MSFPKNNEVIRGGAINETGATIGGAIMDLTDRQNEVLSIIKANNNISYRMIAEQLNVNESAVLKHIEIMKVKGYITRIGGTRGHWQVLI
ncbi:Lrp/AsnC family transcriptional regulator [Pedobacter gandavensis]|uniref:Lrp/AsnC family transcriptional regulator n=1 Tax=Pedobacter gandavensis TaxID=2679963 RepID=UPI00247A5525|nr:Lrp/AsnC family transcriptional regulator [Pedobacter gandavensis]WGQ11524.1 Lrp/AsnC family transcriptional regulator [Pedobacter gandavensis]